MNWKADMRQGPVHTVAATSHGIGQASEEDGQVTSELLHTLMQVDIFSSLAVDDLYEIASLGYFEELPADTILGVTGSHGDVLYVILEGYIELSVPTSSGYLGLGIVKGGGSFPLSALLGDGCLLSTGVAIGSVKTLILPCVKLLGYFARRPAVGARIYRKIAEILADRQGALLRRLVDSTLVACLDEWPSL